MGSTALAARLDPEDLREVIAAYHSAVAEVVAGFDGLVAKYFARARKLWEQLDFPAEYLHVSMANLAITCIAANWIWRFAWTRTCCGRAASATIQAGSFSPIRPAAQATCSAVSGVSTIAC
ncbi:MAG: hypothetical protein WA709_33410 [Stellaceae bacterium]